MAESTGAATASDAAREVTFSVSFRGYDRQQVDEYVRELRLRADRTAAALRAAEERLNELGGDVSVPLDALGSGALGARVERIIALAETEAKELRAQAEEDVSRMRTEMEEEADQSRRFREQAAKASAEESRSMVADAEAEVSKLHDTRRDLLGRLTEIGAAVDRITAEHEETPAPAPRRPLDAKPKPPRGVRGVVKGKAEKAGDAEDAAEAAEAEGSADAGDTAEAEKSAAATG